jgi:hypothetical protein
MPDLLDLAVAAHGGLDRWNQLSSIHFSASITGAIWALKGHDDVLQDVQMTVDTTRQHLVTDFTGRDRRSIFEPHRVRMQRRDGTIVDERADPETSFAGHHADTAWDDLHVAYFCGEALWTYLSVPFLYTRPGFTTEEVAPIHVDGETWRRLKVTFPPEIKTHTRQQISCFGPDGLLRRHDYTVDVLGGAAGLNYATSHRDVSGIVIPTVRRVYGWTGDYQRVPEPLLVAIDLSDITVV